MKEMSRDSRRPGWTKTGCFVLACFVVFAPLILCGVYCAWREGFLGKFAFDEERAYPIAVGFLEDLGAGRIENAYAQTSVRYRSRVDLVSFRVLAGRVAQFEQPINRGDLSVSTSVIPNDRRLAMGITRISEGGRVLLLAALIEEDGQWKIDHFDVPKNNESLQDAIRRLLE